MPEPTFSDLLRDEYMAVLEQVLAWKRKWIACYRANVGEGDPFVTVRPFDVAAERQLIAEGLLAAPADGYRSSSKFGGSLTAIEVLSP